MSTKGEVDQKSQKIVHVVNGMIHFDKFFIIWDKLSIFEGSEGEGRGILPCLSTTPIFFS